MQLTSRILMGITALTLIFLSCSDSSDTPTGTLTLSTFTLSDIDNSGNGSDLSLTYSVSSDLTIIRELRLLLSVSTLTQADADQVVSNLYTVIPTSGSNTVRMNESLSDIDGNTISEQTAYNAYILAVFENSETPSILSPASSITLQNETVVTTPELSGTFNAMEDIVIAPDGTLYVNGGNISPENLYKVTPAGVSSVLSSGLNRAVGITLDDAGNIYSSNLDDTSIKRTTPSGSTTVFANDSRLTGGGGLAFDQDGNLFNAFFSRGVLFKIKDGDVTEFTSSALFDGPIGVVYDQDRQRFYVSSFTSGKIFAISTTGEVTEIADTPASIGHMAYANDHLYITGWNQHKVYQVSLTGEVVETIGRGTNAQLDGPAATAQFSQPNGIDITPDGKYLYVSQGNGTLRKIRLPRAQ